MQASTRPRPIHAAWTCPSPDQLKGVAAAPAVGPTATATSCYSPTPTRRPDPLHVHGDEALPEPVLGNERHGAPRSVSSWRTPLRPWRRASRYTDRRAHEAFPVPDTPSLHPRGIRHGGVLSSCNQLFVERNQVVSAAHHLSAKDAERLVEEIPREGPRVVEVGGRQRPRRPECSPAGLGPGRSLRLRLSPREQGSREPHRLRDGGRGIDAS